MPYDRFNYVHYLAQHRLSENNRFHPLFEAIENAFNAIEESHRNDGLVRVIIRRESTQSLIDDDKKSYTPSPVTGFDVIDNGIGFRDKNWAAFNEVYTEHKKATNGKGVGRLSYLLAFERASVESRWRENGEGRCRTFVIERHSGTSGGEKISCKVDDESTIVKLDGLCSHLRRQCPKHMDAIARHIVQHFFSRFSSSKGILCVLEDEWDGTNRDLRKFCHDEFLLEQTEDSLSVGSHAIQVKHTRCRTGAVNQHQVMFLVDGRVVTTKELPPRFTATKKSLTKGAEKFFYVAFISGDVIKATEDRLTLTLPEDESDVSRSLLADDPDALPTKQEVVNAVGKVAKQFLESVLRPLEDEHRKRIEDFCRRSFAFRPLLTQRIDTLLEIPIGLADDEFEQAVRQVYHQWKSALRSEFNQMAKTVRENVKAWEEHRDRYREVLQSVGEMAMHELAECVSDRRAVIDFLDDRLKQSDTGKFQDEDAIHDIFFLRYQTSDDLPWDYSNLWLIDERLAYQRFIASDKRRDKHGIQETDSEKRPDIAAYYDELFDSTFAFAEGSRPFTSVSLIEFKRPERKEYSDVDNPIAQIFRYIEEIREAKALTNDRHPFRVDKDRTPFHVHIICHIVDELLPYLRPHNHFKTPDGEGIVFYATHYNALIQITTFEKLIADAKKRNEVFFSKLGIDEVAPINVRLLQEAS